MPAVRPSFHLTPCSKFRSHLFLPATKEAQEAASQLRRAANAVRSNYRAARKGRSRAEFEAKLGTVWEEADECVDWLEYLKKVEKVQSGKVESK